jgi:hypothetical protein
VTLPTAPLPAPIDVKFQQLAATQRLALGSLGREPLAVAWLEDRPEVWPPLAAVDRDILRIYERSLDGRYDNPTLAIGLTPEATAALSQEKSKGPESSPATNARRGILLAAEWNQDGRNDLIYASDDGRVYLLARTPLFEPVVAGIPTASNLVVALPEAASPAPVRWVLPLDADQDGDLDLLIGRAGTRPALLRYNGDGTFAETALEMGLAIDGAPGLVGGDIGDLDDDGDLDLLAVDEAGRVQWFDNRRAGKYVSIDVSSDLQVATSVAIADFNNDGRLDIALLKPDGTVLVATRTEDGQYAVHTVGKFAGAIESEPPSIQTWDYDNDGAADLLVVYQGALGVWRNASHPGEAVNVAFTDAKPILPEFLYDPPPQPGQPPEALAAARAVHVVQAAPADADRDGDLDLLVTFDDGHVALLENDGGNHNHWFNVQLRAVLEGDQRNNAFGVGATLEVRAGRAYQKHVVRGSLTHLGINAATQVDTIRIVWPNGFPQHALQPKADAPIAEVQRLKGSCPFLFAWNGSEFAFVTDLLWRSPLGMRVNAQAVASPVTTQDYVKIRADQLVARDGAYELKITAALWETNFFDNVKLVCVDHALDVEVFVDERFVAPEPPPFELYAVREMHPVVSAHDHRGRDVTATIAALDANYLGGFAKGKYQGVAEPHYLEIDLGPWTDPQVVRLLSSGWIHPTDSSLNVAISQGANDPPAALSIWVADGCGDWVEAIPNAGFPAGKNKTMVLDLTGKFPSDDHRVQLRTNLEIYWDRIAMGVGDARVKPMLRSLAPRVAELRFLGYPEMAPANERSPELPDYTRPRRVSPWRDLIGWYTRYGDVRALLAETDDRYVIMNAGDEIALTFEAPPPPPDGWTRDFVLFSDGWVKDGDFNTAESKTVGPLPHHAMTEYPYSPEEAPQTLRPEHSDWTTYHTRFEAPRAYGRRLAPRE